MGSPRRCVCNCLHASHRWYSKECMTPGCSCPQYEANSARWQYNPRVNRFLHPKGVIRSAAEVARRANS